MIKPNKMLKPKRGHHQPAGWDKAVEPLLTPEHVERRSDTEVRIPLPRCPDYDIEEDETIEVLIPPEYLAKSDKPINAGSFTIKADTFEERIDNAIQGLKEEQASLGSDAAVADFLLTFFTCEIVAKSVVGLAKYEKTGRKSLPKDWAPEVIARALKKLKIDFDHESVDDLFSKRAVVASEMSALKLRDNIVHRMKSQYRAAVRERYASLMGTMTEFLRAVEGWRNRSRGNENA